MTDIATHIRIFDAQPTDDLVEKRTNAIRDLSKAFGKGRTVSKILKFASNLSAAVATKGIMSTELASEVEGAIKEYSPAFVQAGNELQMLVCALLATLQFLETATPSKGKLSVADVLAASLWSALSFQKSLSEAKLEALRLELISHSQNMIIATSSSARNRTEVPDFTFTLPEENDWDKNSEAHIKGSMKTINALRINSALDREELDLLWWSLSDWSSLLNETMSASPVEAAAIASGLEVACLLRRFPGDAHKHIVLKGIVKGDSIALRKLITMLEVNREKLAASFHGDTDVNDCPAVFPLLSALSTGEEEGTSDVELTLHEWASRALLERAILHVASLSNPAVI